MSCCSFHTAAILRDRSGDAGLSKDMCDRLQNHSKTSDVSTRHYDRYDYLPERRAAMAKWGTYLDRVLAGEITESDRENRTSWRPTARRRSRPRRAQPVA
jgi:hypothetical protein